MVRRVVIAGLGSIGRRHARIIRKLLPRAEIAALRHASAEGEPDPCVDRQFSRIEEAVGFAPQAAVIAGPAPHHVSTALAFASKGIHLLVEKPLSASVSDARRLVTLCRRRGLVLMTGYNLRYSRSLLRFREEVDNHAVGRVLSVHAEVGQYLPSWRPGSDYRKTVSANASLGGGVLLELSHEIDYLRWIFGRIGWLSCSSTRQSGLEIDVEDTVSMILGIEEHATGRRIAATLDMDFIRRDTTRRCMAIGENGTLLWDGMKESVSIFPAGGADWETVFSCASERDESYTAEWNSFLDCVENGRSPLVSGEEGLADLMVVEAARKSSRLGRAVHLKAG